jgi:hypothetical protein
MTRRRAVPFALAAAATLATSALASPAHAQGLQPPAPLGSGTTGNWTAASSPTPNSADEAEDSGLGLEWVYLNADLGVGYADMASFSSSTLGLQQSSSAGPAFGVAAGVRLIFLSLGVRLEDLALSSFNLWELGAEVLLHMRIWRIDPYFGVRGGYAFTGSLSGDSVGNAVGNAPPDVSIHGFDAGPVFGIDYYFSHLLSLGVDGNAQVLFLQRPKLALPDISAVPASVPPAERQAALAQIQANPLYQESGSSVGLAATVTGHLGIHF